MAEACDWLRDYLALGPRIVSDIMKDARRDGLAEITVKRAKLRAGVRSTARGSAPARACCGTCRNTRQTTRATPRPYRIKPPHLIFPAERDPVWEPPRNGAKTDPAGSGSIVHTGSISKC